MRVVHLDGDHRRCHRSKNSNGSKAKGGLAVLRSSTIGLILSLFFPVSMTLADSLVFENGKTSDLLESSVLESKPQAEIEVGLTSLSFYPEKIDKIALEKTPNKSGFPLSLVGVAEASSEAAGPLKDAFYKIHKTVQQAHSLKDLESVVTPGYMNVLRNKIKSPAQEAFVLMMIQGLRPEKAKVVETRLNENRATVTSEGQTQFGKVYGKMDMVEDQSGWKLEREKWFLADKAEFDNNKPIATAALNLDPQQTESVLGRKTILGTPYKFHRATMVLQKANPTIRKNAFAFTFFMNNENKKLHKGKEFDLVNGKPVNQTTSVHILFPDLDKIVPANTILYNRDTPVNVSVANDDDGYAPGELNLRLPKKRPNAVTASMMWAF